MTPSQSTACIGIDLGGSKISAIAMTGSGEVVQRRRIKTPRHDYEATLKAICELVAGMDQHAPNTAPVGIGIPGSCSPLTGRVRNANSTWLNGHDLASDLSEALGRPVRLANDADCFAVSESEDGAGAGASCVWGVILGTGCGSGIVVDGRLRGGPLAVGGEWGHNPLPWPDHQEQSTAPVCWCGRTGCIETWVSGPALIQDHHRITGAHTGVAKIVARADAGDPDACASLERHTSRLARAMAHVINIVDPDVIVLGGGLSQMPHLYQRLPGAIAAHVFSDHAQVKIVPPRWGDDSGVRGAAWLWRQWLGKNDL